MVAAARVMLMAVTLTVAACGGGAGDPATVTAAATPEANVPLSLTGAPPSEIAASSNYLFQPYASTAGAGLSFSASGLPAWLRLNASTGVLSGTPAESDVGITGDIVITAQSGTAVGIIGPFRIIVRSASVGLPLTPNYPPSLSGIPPAALYSDQNYVFTPAVFDAEGAPLSFSIVNRPAWAAFDTATGLLSGTPGTAAIGVYDDILIRVTDGQNTVALPAFSIRVNARPAAASNAAPQISGAPAGSVMAGQAYSFTPSAADPDGDLLSFQAQNLPAWLALDPATGRLHGTPSGAFVGSYANIILTVGDGRATAQLPPFAITVAAAPASVDDAPSGSGSAVVYWTPPDRNVDGTALSDLAGYRVYWSQNPNNLVRHQDMAWAGYLWAYITDLGPGTWYFSIRAYNSAGVESDPVVVSKTI